MTPNDIEILIHCHVSGAPHPRMHAPAVRSAYAELSVAGLIEYHQGKGYHSTTTRGAAYMKILCSTPLPIRAWIDHNENIIEIDP